MKKKYVLLFFLYSYCGFSFSVEALYESRPLSKNEGYDADDPAIWVHPKNKKKSLVISTLKKGGIDVYNLQGELLQHLDAKTFPPLHDIPQKKPARFNNVDLIYGFKTSNGQKKDLAVVSDRGSDRLRIFEINKSYDEKKSNILNERTSDQAPMIFNQSTEDLKHQKTAYGLASWLAPNGKAMIFVSQAKTTSFAQIELFSEKEKINYQITEIFRLPNSFELPDKSQWTACQQDDEVEAQIEGMVIDPYHQRIFLAQERIGLWSGSLWKPKDLKLIQKVKEYGVPYSRIWDENKKELTCQYDWQKNPNFGGSHIAQDLEGLTIYEKQKGKGYLLVSSQGDHRFVLFDREKPTEFLGEFTVSNNKNGVDGVSVTDGAMVLNKDFGDLYEKGLLVVHDGENETYPENTQSTNFKFIDFEEILKNL